jgi:hypothetical protein
VEVRAVNALALRPPEPSRALRRTMHARWAHLGAMQVDVDRRDLHAVGEYLCIGDLAPSHGRQVVCCINGEYIGRLDWWQPVRVGDVVVFAEVAGASGGGSNPLRILATLAVIALTAGAGGALLLATAPGAMSALTVGVANSLVTGLAVAAVNALFPVSTPQVGSVAAPSPTYSAGLQGNSPRLGAPVPVRYGQEKYFPDQACPPYNEFAGADYDQFYCTGLSIGLGEYELLSIELDDTPIQHFRDVEVEIIGPGMAARTQATGYPAVDTWAEQTTIELGMVTSAEVGGQELRDAEWVGPYAALKSGAAADRIFVDLVFPRGLGTIESDGDIVSRSVAWQIQVRPIDAGGTPTADWSLLATETTTAATTTQVRVTYEYTVAEGRYLVRLRRVSARSTNDRHLNDMAWAQLRCRLSTPGITRTDLTGLVIRIRASSQLSSLTQRRIKVMTRRLLSVYDADTETWGAVEFTRNPAWALADIWRDQVYGRRLPDSRVDLESLADYAAVWAARQDRFDHSFDTQFTTDDAAQLVAAAGRARTMFRRGSVYSLVRDEPQSDPVAVFMPRNMDDASFGLSWALPTSETPDALQLSYRDGRYWEERLVFAQIHDGTIHGYTANEVGVPQRPVGVPAPSVVEEFAAKGVIGEKQAIRMAVYLLARSVYRREEGSFVADIDGLLCSMGSLVGIGHDAAQWGQSGDVVSWDAGTLTLTVSEPPVWTEGQAHYVRLQEHTGGMDGAVEVTPGATDFEMVLAEAPGFTPSFDDAGRERTRYLFGALADVMRYAVIAGVRPTSMDEVQMPFFIEDDRVHTADAAWLPTGDEEQDPLADGAVDEEAEPTAFSEDFEEYADETDMNGTYTLVSGADFVTLETGTDYGQSLLIQSISSGTVHRYRRELPADMVVSDLRLKFKMPSLEEDDAGIMTLRNDGAAVISFNPRRDFDFDDDQCPVLSIFTKRGRFTIGALDADTWYSLRLLIVPGAGNTSAAITRIEDNELVGTVGFADSFDPIPVDQLEWVADSGGTTTPTQYDDLTIT